LTGNAETIPFSKEKIVDFGEHMGTQTALALEVPELGMFTFIFLSYVR
jgi:hypothetical protein